MAGCSNFFGSICRHYLYSGKMRNKENGFGRGDSCPDAGRAVVFVADGIYCRFRADDIGYRIELTCISGAVGYCHGRLMDMLF